MSSEGGILGSTVFGYRDLIVIALVLVAEMAHEEKMEK